MCRSETVVMHVKQKNYVKAETALSLVSQSKLTALNSETERCPFNIHKT